MSIVATTSGSCTRHHQAFDAAMLTIIAELQLTSDLQFSANAFCNVPLGGAIFSLFCFFMKFFYFLLLFFCDFFVSLFLLLNYSACKKSWHRRIDAALLP
jgi:hypothetical protein